MPPGSVGFSNTLSSTIAGNTTLPNFDHSRTGTSGTRSNPLEVWRKSHLWEGSSNNIRSISIQTNLPHSTSPSAMSSDAVRKSNMDVGGKTVEIATTQFFVRGRGYIKNISDLEDVVLKVENGVPIYLKNVGTSTFGTGLRVGCRRTQRAR